MHAEIVDFINQIHLERDLTREPEDQRLLTDEEIVIIELARNNWQEMINKCRYVVIQKLIAEGWIVEVWPSFSAHFGEPVIRPAWEVSEAHQSTNRI